jgi:anti-sigma factor (TIGR02949 family)
MEDKSDNLGCSECVDLLADYMDGALPSEQAERLEWHLAACPPCVAFVKTYRGTVDAAARLRQVTLPSELRDRLIAFLQRPAR